MHDNATPRRLKSFRPFQNLTGRFIALYIALVFVPTVVFIGIYSDTLARQQRSEIRYSEQLMLNQSATYLSNLLTQDESFITAFQGEDTLLNLLEGSFSSPEEELLACVTYVQPMMTSILASYPFVRDLYIYRYEPSFITSSDLVYNLPMADQFPYDPARLTSAQMTQRFLVNNPEEVRHLKGQASASAQYISLIQIYNRAFSKVVGMMEVQIDVDRALTALDLTQNGGTLYLHDGMTGISYPVRFTPTGAHLDWAAGTQETPSQAGAQILREQVKGTELSLVYLLGSPAFQSVSRWRNVVLVALILLIPTTFVCAFIYRYVQRMTRFGAHIRNIEQGALIPYGDDASDDELGSVVSAYNDMVDTIHTLIGQVRQAEQLTNAATYYAMSSQVNPHFMFNTLENIRMQIEVEHYADASKMLFVLGRFLRYNISMRRESTLADELTHIEHYLMIYHYRAQSLIQFTIDKPEDMDLAAIRCPFCMLQPIVENCIKHGIRDDTPLIIHVTIRMATDGIVITLSDNGSGMTQAEIDALNASFAVPEIREQSAGVHVGLGNVSARVKYFYGPGYGVTVSGPVDGGLRIDVHIGLEPIESIPAQL